MGNIITYVRQCGHMAFDELGFNAVDSLIFSQLAYLDFSCCAAAKIPFSMTIAGLRAAGLNPACPANEMGYDRCLELFEAMEQSRRFGGVGVDGYVSEIDPAEEKQFSAVTFRLSPRLHYIAYRGTDSTVVGWKEDLNMSYRADVPAQRAAVEYFEAAASRMRSHYILGGHSKGGNLAVYAAAHAQEKFQRDVALIYDHDGPGFLEEVLQRQGFSRIERRIYKSVPESAVVGLLLEEHEKYTVVASDAAGLMQHDPFSWRVEGAEFVTLPETDLFSRATDRTVSRWLSENDEATRKAFVDALFSIIGATGARTIPELTENPAKNALPAAAAVRDMAPSLRRLVTEALRGLLRASGHGVRGALDDEWSRLRGTLEEQLSQVRQELRGEWRERFRRAGEDMRDDDIPS